MVEESTRQTLLQAIEGLQKDLDKKSEKLMELEAARNTVKAECEQLKSLIQRIKHQLGITTVGGGLILGGFGIVTHIISKPIAEGISEIFDEFKRPMDVNEIVVEFRKRGWKLSQNHPPEVIRGALKRRPNLFMKIARGTWMKIQKI